MIKIITLLTVTFIYVASCNAQEGIKEMNTTNQQPTANTEATTYIGEAWMEDNREVVMQLFAQENNGPSGQALFRYKPDHPQYNEIIKHLNGLNPGERKGVLPWPDAK